MCPSISAISDRSFRGSVNYCMPMVLNIKEHEQFFKKCVQKMLTTATGLNLFKQQNNSRFFREFFRKSYCCFIFCAYAAESDMSMVEFFVIFFQESTLTAVQAAALLKHSMISGCWLRE